MAKSRRAGRRTRGKRAGRGKRARTISGGRRRRSHRYRRGGTTVRFDDQVQSWPGIEGDPYPGGKEEYFYPKPRARPSEDDVYSVPDCESVYFQKFPCSASYGRLGEDTIVLHDEDEYRIFQEADRNLANQVGEDSINFKANIMMMKGDPPQKVMDRKRKFQEYQERPKLRDYLHAHGSYPPPPALEEPGGTRPSTPIFDYAGDTDTD